VASEEVLLVYLLSMENTKVQYINNMDYVVFSRDFYIADILNV
jgi:hypothetical protein